MQSNRKTSRKSTNTSEMPVIKGSRDAVRERVLTLVDRKSEFVGTMTDLDRALTSGIRRAAPSVWPGSPSTLRKVLNTVVSSLRKSGVSVKFGRTPDHERTRFVVLARKD